MFHRQTSFANQNSFVQSFSGLLQPQPATSDTASASAPTTRRQTSWRVHKHEQCDVFNGPLIILPRQVTTSWCHVLNPARHGRGRTQLEHTPPQLEHTPTHTLSQASSTPQLQVKPSSSRCRKAELPPGHPARMNFYSKKTTPLIKLIKRVLKQYQINKEQSRSLLTG